MAVEDAGFCMVEIDYRREIRSSEGDGEVMFTYVTESKIASWGIP